MCSKLESWGGITSSCTKRNNQMLPLYYSSDFNSPTQLEEFIKDWDENGPNSVGPELDKGVRLMDPYGHKLAERELRRQELANAERLFDMPMVDYNEFGRVQDEFDGLILV